MIPVIPGCIFKSSWSELSDNHLEWDQWSWHHIDIQNIPELSKMVLILCILIFIFSCDRVLPTHSFAFGMCQRYVNPLPGTCRRNISSVDEDRTIGLFHKSSSKHQKGSSSYHSLQSDAVPFSKAMTGFIRRPSPNSVRLIWCNGWNSNVKPGAKSKSLLNLGPLFSKTKIHGNIHCQMLDTETTEPWKGQAIQTCWWTYIKRSVVSFKSCWCAKTRIGRIGVMTLIPLELLASNLRQRRKQNKIFLAYFWISKQILLLN